MCFTFCMVTSQVVIKVGESSNISCNILLIGYKRFKMSSFTELKSNDFKLAIFLQIPSRMGTSFFMVWLCGCFICWSQKPIKIGNYGDEISMQQFNVQPILFHLIFCSTFCLNSYINFAAWTDAITMVTFFKNNKFHYNLFQYYCSEQMSQTHHLLKAQIYVTDIKCINTTHHTKDYTPNNWPLHHHYTFLSPFQTV